MTTASSAVWQKLRMCMRQVKPRKFWFLTADMDKPELKMVDIYWGI